MNILKKLFTPKPPAREFVYVPQKEKLAPEVAMLADLMARPERWQPSEPLTQADIEALRALLQQPLMRKLDLVMYNMAQMQMRNAAFAPVADMVAQGKFAAGYKAAWEQFKSFSVLVLTNQDENGEAATGADASEPYIP